MAVSRAVTQSEVLKNRSVYWVEERLGVKREVRETGDAAREGGQRFCPPHCPARITWNHEHSQWGAPCILAFKDDSISIRGCLTGRER